MGRRDVGSPRSDGLWLVLVPGGCPRWKPCQNPSVLKIMELAAGSQGSPLLPSRTKPSSASCSRGPRGACGASAVPRERRCQPATTEQPHPALLSLVVQPQGRKGEQLCRVGSSSCSEQSTPCLGHGARLSLTLSRPCLPTTGDGGKSDFKPKSSRGKSASEGGRLQGLLELKASGFFGVYLD